MTLTHGWQADGGLVVTITRYDGAKRYVAMSGEDVSERTGHALDSLLRGIETAVDELRNECSSIAGALADPPPNVEAPPDTNREPDPFPSGHPYR